MKFLFGDDDMDDGIHTSFEGGKINFFGSMGNMVFGLGGKKEDKDKSRSGLHFGMIDGKFKTWYETGNGKNGTIWKL